MTRLSLRRRSEGPRDHALVVAAPLVLQSVLVATSVWARWALGAAADADKAFTLALLHAPIALLAAAVAWRAARAARGPSRRAWTLIAAAAACGAVGVRAPTEAALLATFVQYPLALLAFASFPTEPRDDDDRTAVALDAAMIVAAGAALVWYAVMRGVPTTALAAPGVARALLMTALSLVTLGASIAVLLRRPSSRIAAPVGVLALAWAAATVAGALDARAATHGTPPNDVAEHAWLAGGAWLVTVAATVVLAPRRLRGLDRRVYATLPHVALAAVLGVLLDAGRRAERGDHAAALTGLTVGAVAAIALLAWRLVATQRHNALLVAHGARRESRFRALVRHASDVVVVVDAEGVVLDAAPSVERALGIAPDTLVGRPIADVVAAPDRTLARTDLAQVVARGATADAPTPYEWRIERADGDVRWVEVLCTNLLDDPAVRGIVVNARDVSERKALEAELTRQAYHDSLTGLVNRGRFRAIVEEALTRRASVTEMVDRPSLAVLYIDLDDFKPVNDSLGHGAGDRVLAVVTERLRDATRGSDVVARIGGDEFAVLLEHVRDADEAAAVARRVLAKLQQPIVIERSIIGVGASIGIACADVGRAGGPRLVRRHARPRVQTATCDALLRDADEAMYDAKQQGGRRYVVHAPRVVGA